LPAAEARSLSKPGEAILTTKQVADYVLAHFAVLRQGKACPVLDQGQDLGFINALSLTPGLLRFEMVFRCPDSSGLTLSDPALFDRAPNHFEFGRIQINNGGFVQHVFTAGDTRFDLQTGGGILRGDPPARYASLGLWHVLHGFDVICFVLAVLLIGRSRNDYIF